MNISQRLAFLAAVREIIAELIEDTELLMRAELKNPWFTVQNSQRALLEIHDRFLQPEALDSWINPYPIPKENIPLSVGLVLAGNLPLVGFHDWLCVFICGHKPILKLSTKDDVLLPAILQRAVIRGGMMADYTEIVERLKDIDAVIATGSNNTSRYFDYYFGRYPHIIRRNRTSVAVLDGRETDQELAALADDVFFYFGMGCRNVSKIFLPIGYDVTLLFTAFERYSYLKEHNKYKNNLDYRVSILLLNQVSHLASEWMIMEENENLFSPLATLYYSFYKDEESLSPLLAAQRNNLQCIIGRSKFCDTEFGQGQCPTLLDYADNIDTMKFLLELK